MCKKYSIDKNNEEEYKKYLEWLVRSDSEKHENPYKDPDSNNKVKRVPEFYQDLCKFLNKREQELEQKLDKKYKYYFDENDRTYGIQVKEKEGNEEKLLFYLKSDQLGFSRPSEEDTKYIYDIYLKKLRGKAIKNIVCWVSNTRTVGGSFLWPMELKESGEWNQNPAYNRDRGGSENGGKNYYIQDRSDLTLFEVKNLYSNQNTEGNKLYREINKWPNMKKWLDHFKNFETYVEFFGFKINDGKKSFVNDKYEVRNIFPFKKEGEEEVEYFGEDFSIKEYIETYFKKFNIYNEKQDGYIDKIEKMLNLITELIKERSKWMEKRINDNRF